MHTLHKAISSFVIISALILFSSSLTWGFVDEPGKEMSIYSPVIRVEPEKGFVLVSTHQGILWIRASEAAKPHLQDLPVGSLVDFTIVFQGKPNPPLLKSWKMASGESSCKIFDGKTCQNSAEP